MHPVGTNLSVYAKCMGFTELELLAMYGLVCSYVYFCELKLDLMGNEHICTILFSARFELVLFWRGLQQSTTQWGAIHKTIKSARMRVLMSWLERMIHALNDVQRKLPAMSPYGWLACVATMFSPS